MAATLSTGAKSNVPRYLPLKAVTERGEINDRAQTVMKSTISVSLPERFCALVSYWILSD